MKLRAAKGEGRVREEELQEHAAGLICITGDDDGPLALALHHGKSAAWKKRAAASSG